MTVKINDVSTCLKKVFNNGKLDMAKAKEFGVDKYLKDGMSIYEVEKILKGKVSKK